MGDVQQLAPHEVALRKVVLAGAQLVKHNHALANSVLGDAYKDIIDQLGIYRGSVEMYEQENSRIDDLVIYTNDAGCMVLVPADAGAPRIENTHCLMHHVRAKFTEYGGDNIEFITSPQYVEWLASNVSADLSNDRVVVPLGDGYVWSHVVFNGGAGFFGWMYIGQIDGFGQHCYELHFGQYIAQATFTEANGYQLRYVDRCHSVRYRVLPNNADVEEKNPQQTELKELARRIYKETIAANDHICRAARGTADTDDLDPSDVIDTTHCIRSYWNTDESDADEHDDEHCNRDADEHDDEHDCLEMLNVDNDDEHGDEHDDEHDCLEMLNVDNDDEHDDDAANDDDDVDDDDDEHDDVVDDDEHDDVVDDDEHDDVVDDDEHDDDVVNEDDDIDEDDDDDDDCLEPWRIHNVRHGSVHNLRDVERLMNERSACIVQRERELDERANELNARGRKFTVRIAELDARKRELDERTAWLDARKRELDERTAELNLNKYGHTTRMTKLDARRRKFTVRTAELDARKRELDERTAELDARKRELDARNAELDARKCELNKIDQQNIHLNDMLGDRLQQLQHDKHLFAENLRRQYDSELQELARHNAVLKAQVAEYAKALQQGGWYSLSAYRKKDE